MEWNHLSDLVPLDKAVLKFPKPPSKATLYRWIRSGYRGIKLEAIEIPDGMATTECAIKAFLRQVAEQSCRVECGMSNSETTGVIEAVVSGGNDGQ